MPTTARGRHTIELLSVFTVLTTLSLAGRFWSAALQKRSYRLDDFLVVFAFLCLLALEIPVFISYTHNLGAHTADLTEPQRVLLLKIQLSAGITWTLATCSCKVAVLWMYLHIFPHGQLKFVIYCSIGVAIAYAITFIPIFMTSCNPPSASWSSDINYTIAHCKPIQQQEFASVAVNMALDLAVVIIPMPSVWRLQLRLSKKIFVTLMFSCGLIIVAVMAWRIQATVASTKTTDWSYVFTVTVIQSHLELYLGIIAANLPMMSPLLTRLILPGLKSFAKSWSSTFKSSMKSSEGSTIVVGPSRKQFSDRDNFRQLKDKNESVEIALTNMDQWGDDGESGPAAHDNSLPPSAIRRDIEINVSSVEGTHRGSHNDF